MSEATIADRIRTARKAAGLSQPGLAERANVGVSTIRDIEQGVTTDPRLSTVEAILAAIRSIETEDPATTAAQR